MKTQNKLFLILFSFMSFYLVNQEVRGANANKVKVIFGQPGQKNVIFPLPPVTFVPNQFFVSTPEEPVGQERTLITLTPQKVSWFKKVMAHVKKIKNSQLLRDVTESVAVTMAIVVCYHYGYQYFFRS